MFFTGNILPFEFFHGQLLSFFLLFSRAKIVFHGHEIVFRVQKVDYLQLSRETLLFQGQNFDIFNVSRATLLFHGQFFEVLSRWIFFYGLYFGFFTGKVLVFTGKKKSLWMDTVRPRLAKVGVGLTCSYLICSHII